MAWPKPSDEHRQKLRTEIHLWKPWERSRKKYTPEWAVHMQAICKKVDGYYSSNATNDKKRLREAIKECEALIKLSALCRGKSGPLLPRRLLQGAHPKLSDFVPCNLAQFEHLDR